jgi:peptidoglycan hydrolase CwlO-like protein
LDSILDSAKEAGLAAKIADVDAACKATVAEAESRKDAIESKIDSAGNKLTAIEEQIRAAKADLDAAVSNRSSELASRTAEAEQRLAQLNRDIDMAEDRLAITQTSLKKLREHLAAQ